MRVALGFPRRPWLAGAALLAVTLMPGVAALVAAGGCAGTEVERREGAPRLLAVNGATMGTTFTVKVATDGGVAEGTLDPAALQAAVQGRLDRIETRMSHYRPDSELSRFNGARSTAPQPISAETLAVVAEALAVSRASAGAFDVTVGPLVDAWGFGPGGRARAAPDGSALAALRTGVGFELLEIDQAASTLRKRREEVAIDLSAIAKGYAVDAVASLLGDLGAHHYLVEIGGELRAAGTNEQGAPWRIAIERPAAGAAGGQHILSLTDAAIATSGDYRNFYDLDGVRVSHTIDPRTGRPVTHGLRSVSVIAERCILADARSTALAVLGPDDGYALAVERGWAARFVADDGTGRLSQRETPAFTAVR